MTKNFSFSLFIFCFLGIVCQHQALISINEGRIRQRCVSSSWKYSEASKLFERSQREAESARIKPQSKVTVLSDRPSVSPVSNALMRKSQVENISGSSSSILSSITNSTELDLIISNMPIQEKYALLIQSYAGKILDLGGNSNTEKDFLIKIERLYSEMTILGLKREKKSIQNIIDAASSFGSIDLFSKTIKLLKKGADTRTFGVAVGQLTNPIFQNLNSSLFSTTSLPKDAREIEVSYAIGGLLFAFNWISFQFLDAIFHQNLDLYNTIITVLFASLFVYDIVYRKAEEIKLTIAGFERLLFRDPSRQAYLDACSFVSGYLLGLPSFCYTAGINEGLKMIELHPYSLQVYKQSIFSTGVSLKRAKTSLKDSSRPSSSSSPFGLSEEQYQSLVQQITQNFQLRKINPSTILSTPEKVDKDYLPREARNPTEVDSSLLLEKLADNSLFDYLWKEQDRRLALGRLLVWFMVPVAAEMAKYGQTMLSDPGRGRKFCESLEAVLNNQKRSIEEFLASPSAFSDRPPTKSAIEFYQIASLLPKEANDREALLEWAYYEATILLRQYGDLFEEVNDYLRTGTATVGECVLLIEDRLT